MNRGFRPAIPRPNSFPSVGTFEDKNCVSIDNFRLYVNKIDDYNTYSQLYHQTLESAISKIKNDMIRNVLTPKQYTENETNLIRGIQRIIISKPQIDDDGKQYNDGRRKTICPNLLRIIGSVGGKNRRRYTTKQKRKTYSRKSKKTTRSRYRKRK